MQLFVCSYGTNPKECEELLASADKSGIPINMYGNHERWAGFHRKLEVMLNFCKSVETTHGLASIVCFVDGYDVLLARPAGAIVQAFLDTNCQLLLSAEQFLNPDKKGVRERYPPSSETFKYVNSGTYIGTVQAVRYMLEWCARWKGFNVPRADGHILYPNNDQRSVTTFYLQHWRQGWCKLDTTQSVFACLAGLDPFVALKGGRHPQTGQFSCIYHLNGKSKRHKKKLLLSLTCPNSSNSTLRG